MSPIVDKTIIATEPLHPTYGTLNELLAQIAIDTRYGYDLRIGLEGALRWFAHQYGERRLNDGKN